MNNNIICCIYTPNNFYICLKHNTIYISQLMIRPYMSKNQFKDSDTAFTQIEVVCNMQLNR